MITHPVSTTVLFIGDTIQVNVECDDVDGSITKVLVFIDDVLQDTLFTAPYTYTWITNDLSIGPYSILCKAIDNDYAEGSDKVVLNFDKSTSFTDYRDGQVYQTICFGNQVWMAEKSKL